MFLDQTAERNSEEDSKQVDIGSPEHIKEVRIKLSRIMILVDDFHIDQQEEIDNPCNLIKRYEFDDLRDADSAYNCGHDSADGDD